MKPEKIPCFCSNTYLGGIFSGLINGWASAHMNTARRYLECFLFVIVWVACGWLFRPSPQVYLFLGIPWLVFFQLAVARRPISQLWARDAKVLCLDRPSVAMAAVFILVAVGALVGQHDYPDRMAAFLFAITGAVPAAFALRQQRGKLLRQAWPSFALAVAIGGAIFVVLAMHHGRSPALDLSKLASIGRTTLWLFAIFFAVEEVVFRGGLDTHVAGTSGEGWRSWASALFISALWGLWHFPLCHTGDEAIVLVNSIALGVPLSFCWRQSRTLVLPAAAHALFDAYRNVIFTSPAQL